jgi:uncharacterized DUF497 family protein
MLFEWDAWKAAANVEKHGVSFDDAQNLDFVHAIVRADLRFTYGESRWVAMGPIGSRKHVLVFTRREAEIVRVISLRKANSREMKFYVEAKAGLDQSGRLG